MQKPRSITMLLALILLISFTPLWSNIRAPFKREFSGGENLKKVNHLTVMYEKLDFRFEKYYTGSMSTAYDFKANSEVTAEYIVRGDKTESFSFSFISPSAENVSIKINDKICSHSIKILKNDPRKNQPRWRDESDVLYQIDFNGILINGDNKILVKYLQPLSMREISYGYITPSKWSVSAPYLFSPIKEWLLDKNFRADITLSVPYDRCFTDILFGEDIELNCQGFMDDMTTVNPLEYHTEWNGKLLIRNFSFSGILPDTLNIFVSEK